MSNKPRFIERDVPKFPRDYITEANAIIKSSGDIDPNSTTYQNAIDQYNGELLRGTTRRLEVPSGFCGYIDPATGRFRVEPNPLGVELRSSTLFPNDIIDPEDVPSVETIPYPLDQCLQVGLPGSSEYSDPNTRCGEEKGDNECSGINWFPNVDEFGSSVVSGGGGGSADFLWKPISESNGKLVILLPSSMRGTRTCIISGSFGSEDGSFAGEDHNGARPHFRYSRPGGGYGTNITVRAGGRTWVIPNGSSRFTAS